MLFSDCCAVIFPDIYFMNLKLNGFIFVKLFDIQTILMSNYIMIMEETQ